MLSNVGRAAIKRIGGSNLSTNRLLATVCQLQRVEGQHNVESTLKASSTTFSSRRLYATATKATQTKTVIEKKPVAKKAPAKKSTTAAKPAVKKSTKTTAKKTAKPVKKPVKKPAKKTVAKKPGPKPKKQLTDSQKLKLKLKELKAIAFLKEAPKQIPDTAYSVLFIELVKKGTPVIDAAKEASEKYKSSSTAELERLEQIAKENKAVNSRNYKNWVESHTPAEIRTANYARHHIRRLTNRSASPRIIKDDRLVKNVTSSLFLFMRERYSSGDFANLSIAESSKKIAQEYKSLSPEQRKPFEDAAVADQERYVQEYRTVYGEEPKVALKAQAKA
ncbi:putative hmg box protein [Botrytis fragariae]|uniref:Putative hmg box protein n=1 Tax=Botrytis fragariae TaxID=1964551 RepID=A0A8H6EFF2_9HELO|nr:putative hmg box protein [Botrytis fragariae]KAF5870211.1 putative hmg box protein [Botrytis fragariae]